MRGDRSQQILVCKSDFMGTAAAIAQPVMEESLVWGIFYNWLSIILGVWANMDSMCAFYSSTVFSASFSLKTALSNGVLGFMLGMCRRSSAFIFFYLRHGVYVFCIALHLGRASMRVQLTACMVHMGCLFLHSIFNNNWLGLQGPYTGKMCCQ